MTLLVIHRIHFNQYLRNIRSALSSSICHVTKHLYSCLCFWFAFHSLLDVVCGLSVCAASSSLFVIRLLAVLSLSTVVVETTQDNREKHCSTHCKGGKKKHHRMISYRPRHYVFPLCVNMFEWSYVALTGVDKSGKCSRRWKEMGKCSSACAYYVSVLCWW